MTSIIRKLQNISMQLSDKSKVYTYLRNNIPILNLVSLILNRNSFFLKQNTSKNFKKKSLDKLTIIIPVFFDFKERITNLGNCLDYINLHFDVEILIAESGTTKRFQALCSQYPNVNYYFFEDTNPYFHRTHYINKLATLAKNEILLILDADVLINPYQLTKSIDLISTGQADLVYPYSGLFLDAQFETIQETLTKKRLTPYLYLLPFSKIKLQRQDSLGGAFLINKKKYQEIGLENENFKAWGLEDDERFRRAKKLNLKIKRIEGVLYHQMHKRSKNSQFNKYSENNQRELEKISSLGKDELKQYIESWSWHNIKHM